VVIT